MSTTYNRSNELKSKGDCCLPHSCQGCLLMVRPRPELRQDAGSENCLNSSSYPQVCLSSTFQRKHRLSQTSDINHQQSLYIQSEPRRLRFRWFLKDAVAVGALHHETPAQALPSCSGVVEVGERVGHGRDTFTRHHLPATGSLILAWQPERQPVQRRVQRAWHVCVSGLRATQWRGGVRRQFADERGEEVGVAGLCRLDQAVHVDVELLLLEGAGEDGLGEVLHPGEQRQIQVVTAVTAQHVDTQEHLALCDLLTCRLALHTNSKVIITQISEAQASLDLGVYVWFRVSNLAELDTALIEDSFEEKLEKSIPAGLETSLTQLPVCRDELRYHRAGLLKTLHPGRARVPILRDMTKAEK